jgi:hypothetical protein
VVIDEGTVDFAGDEPLETADDILLAPGSASVDIIDGGLMRTHTNRDDPVECRVGLAMAAAKEPVAMRHPPRRGNRARAAQLCKCGLDRTLVGLSPATIIISAVE